MGNSLVQTLVALGALVGAGTGLYSLLTLRPAKEKILAEAMSLRAQSDNAHADAAAKVSASARDWIERMEVRVRDAEERARQAEVSAAAASAEAAAALEQMAEVQQVAHEVMQTLTEWRAAILDPSAQLDRLRLMVTR